MFCLPIYLIWQMTGAIISWAFMSKIGFISGIIENCFFSASMKCHASASLNLLLDILKCRFWVTETPASTRSSKINKTEKWKCFLDLTMRQNVSKVLNFRTLWKSLRRQRKSFSWSTLQSMECTILINNELDFSPLLTKITYTCSLLEIYCKINLFLEVKMCLKKTILYHILTQVWIQRWVEMWWL